MARVKVDASGAFKKLNAERKRIVGAGKATTKELVNLGKMYAKQYVPKDTRQTYDSIHGRTLNNANGSSGQVYIKLKNRTGDNKTTHQVARYMAQGQSGRGRGGYSHFKSGNPRFMLNTRNYLNRIKKQIGMKNIKRGKTPGVSTSV